MFIFLPSCLWLKSHSVTLRQSLENSRSPRRAAPVLQQENLLGGNHHCSECKQWDISHPTKLQGDFSHQHTTNVKAVPAALSRQGCGMRCWKHFQPQFWQSVRTATVPGCRLSLFSATHLETKPACSQTPEPWSRRGERKRSSPPARRASAPQAIVRISHQAPHGKTSPLRSGMSPHQQPGVCLPDSWCSLRCQPPYCVQQAQGEPPPTRSAAQSYKNMKYLMANMPTVCTTGSMSHISGLFTTCQAERTCLGALRSHI